MCENTRRETKDKFVGLRLTEREHQAMLVKADTLGLNISDAVKAALKEWVSKP